MAERRKSELLLGSMPMLRAYVRRLVRNRDTAHDVLQEVSLCILSTDPPVQPDRFSAWSRGVARHVAARALSKNRRIDGELGHDHAVSAARDPGPSPERHADLRQMLSRAVDDLDDSSLELVLRRYLLQETPKEMADELTRSAASVRMRLMRLRTTLRRGEE